LFIEDELNRNNKKAFFFFHIAPESHFPILTTSPAAVDLLKTHFEDTARKPDYYDVIATGDLGYVGKDLVVKLMEEEGYEMGDNYTDCGIEIFDKETQDTHAGGSGCACSALTFGAYFYPKLLSGEIRRMLFIPTGALMSPTSSQQGGSIPGIAHGLVIESRAKFGKKEVKS